MTHRRLEVRQNAIQSQPYSLTLVTEQRPRRQFAMEVCSGFGAHPEPLNVRCRGRCEVSDPVPSWKHGDNRAPSQSLEQRCNRILRNMEASLTARDRVGIQDFVLLDAYTSETAFLDNLRKRFHENLIYTYIGTLLVSVNPYKELDMYTQKQMDLYMGVNFFELPPHIYALADNAFRTMMSEFNNHFILISGESGAGKTEASKKILQFYAVSCPSTKLLNNIRDRLLLSNPVLEAFGNAKTLKNDNSSRFGKYMDIQFDHQGGAVGGHILSYLLEKSRVVHQNHGERNFHIFYQLVEGGEEELLRWLGLERNCQVYSYLMQGNCPKVSSINDKSDWRTVRNALSVIDFSEADIENLFAIIASVLHLGNIKFNAGAQGYATLNNSQEVHWVSKLLGIPAPVLQHGLTHKKIEAKTEEVHTPFSVEHAVYARDALAKAIYGRTFNWLVNKVNESLANKDSSRKTVIGLLDIYGFEVFSVNSFEQFCINYCNEKLQQLFIQLTLKSEQEEYGIEGIEWEPVPYFNNKIICDLVEAKHTGIISLLDEECLRPGEATDLTFLEKMEEEIGNHPHFVTHKLANQKTRKTLERGRFSSPALRRRGDILCRSVTFCVSGFLDKNNDLLYRTGKEVMRQSSNAIIKLCFPASEPDSKKRPETVVTQFKASLTGLTEILMSKERGMFAASNQTSLNIQTWPNWKGTAAEGVLCLIKHLGYTPDEYKMAGKHLQHNQDLKLSSTCDIINNIFVEEQKSSSVILGHCLQRKMLFSSANTSLVYQGFMTRHEPACVDNSEYLAYVRQSYLTRLKENLPRTVLEKDSWLTPPPVLQEMLLKVQASSIFKGKKENYPFSVCLPFSNTRIAEEDISLKVLQMIRPERIQYSVPVVKYDRNGFRPRLRQLIFTQEAAYLAEEAKIKQRIDFNSLKGVSVSNLSDNFLILHVINEDMKQNDNKQKLMWQDLTLLNPFVLSVCAVGSGDLVLQCDYLFEALTKLCVIAKKQNCIQVVQGSVRFDIHPGREGFVDFKSGQESMVYRTKNGHLMVESRTKSRI
ncbi:hypothetical protein WMY93_020611 [Mugilogobius chulae]|uniref:Myosin IHb n=1 Tax=Mugilogobius chulae TaxID=88201 RepID=A0AAW0NKL9_9GOBI